MFPAFLMGVYNFPKTLGSLLILHHLIFPRNGIIQLHSLNLLSNLEAFFIPQKVMLLNMSFDWKLENPKILKCPTKSYCDFFFC